MKYKISRHYLKLFLCSLVLFLFNVNTVSAQILTYGEGGLKIYGIHAIYFVFIIFVFVLFRKPIIETWNDRQLRKSREARLAREEKENTKKVVEDMIQQIKKSEMDQYQQLRREIESMPQHQQWRQGVLEKFGRRCAVCGSTENIEVDHRYESFYAIVTKYGITNIIQAYECPALWDINNGAPLCKLHHDQTKSSLYHKQNNS